MYNTIMQNTKLSGSIFQKNGIPLYLQLASFIRRNIENGTWPDGMRMPSLETMAADFNIARLTVRQAIQHLVAEQLLASRQGHGTFVTSANIAKNFQRLQTSWDDLVIEVQEADVKVLVERDVDYCPSLHDEEQLLLPSYRFMKRVHSMDNMPFALLDIYLAQHIFAQNPVSFSTRPILTVLRELSFPVAKARQVLTVGGADAEAAHHLKIGNGDPVAHVRRIAKDTNGYTIYMANIIFRGDQIRLDVDLLTSHEQNK